MKIRAQIAIIAVFILIIGAAAGVFAETRADVTRICLASFGTPKKVTLSSTCGLSVVNTKSGEPVAGDIKESVTIDASKGALNVAGDSEAVGAGDSVTVTPTDPATILTISAGESTRKYRGAIEVRTSGAGLRLINVVKVEDYLLGVVPAEMPELFPMESLKAQAVAARTYVYSNRTKHASEDCELCDSTHCQAYGGVLSEQPKCSQAVADTCGEILTFNGKPASIQYSADCGGITRPCDSPYMCSIVEPEDIKHCSWELNYTPDDLEKKLVAAGVKEAAGLKSISVSKTDTAGWVIDVDVTGETTSATITSSRLRTVLGSLTMKSALFTIEQLPDGMISIKGKGNGHGKGLCQVGAKGLALPPHNFTCDQILAHYFPGTSIAGEILPAATGADVAMVSDGGRGPEVARLVVEEAPVPVRVIDAPKAAARPTKKQERLPFAVRLQEP